MDVASSAVQGDMRGGGLPGPRGDIAPRLRVEGAPRGGRAPPPPPPPPDAAVWGVGQQRTLAQYEEVR